MKRNPQLAESFVKSLAFSLALVGAAAPSMGGEVFFSEYIDGSGLFNRALEIYNPTGLALDTAVEELTIEVYEDGSAIPTSTVAFGSPSGVIVAPASTFLVVQFGADSPLIDAADRTTLGLSFDGNDAVVLRRSGLMVDVIGQIGFDPGSSGWGSGDTSTQNRTLRRNPDVCEGDTDGSIPFDPADEWTGYSQDTFDGAGEHGTDCAPTSVQSETWGRVKATFRH